MTAVRPTWVRRLYWTLGVTAGAGVVSAFFLYWQVTSDIAPIRHSNVLDAEEAARKLSCYDNACKVAQKGYIRLSEAEINSYLKRQFFSRHIGNPTLQQAALVDSEVELLPDEMIWLNWMNQSWLGRPVTIAWQRTFRIEPKTSRGWALTLTSMKLGRITVPRTLWSFVQSKLGEVDQPFVHEADWLAKVPAIEIGTNVMSMRPEVRLYTFCEPASGRKLRP